MSGLARQILDAHRADPIPGRAPDQTRAPRPDHLLIAPGAIGFVLRLADATLQGAPPAVRAIGWSERALPAPAPGDDEGRELLDIAKRLGIPVLAPVAGACEPAYRESLAAPGRLIATCGFAASASGALGMRAWRVTPLEAAALLCGAPVAPPASTDARLVLEGGLPPGCGGLDAALEFARRADLRRWRGCGIDVSGAGVVQLGFGDRIALARTLVQCGAAFVVMPSDDVTRAVLRAWGRDADWRELRTAAFDAELTVTLDLDAIEPLVAPLADVTLARPLRHALEHPLHAVTLGPFCDEDDVAVWATRLAGSRVAAGLDVAVVPGTAAGLATLAGTAEALALRDAGVVLPETTPPADGARAGSGTRLGLGTAGTDARAATWWLANAHVCAASALAGALADPRDGTPARSHAPRHVRAGDGRPSAPVALPTDDAAPVTARPAASMAPPPDGALRAVVWVVVGDDWPAERIVSRSARARREVLVDPVAGLFPGMDRGWTALAGAECRGVVVAGRHFGGGDVADEAAWALRRAGVAAVIARSFAPDFARALGASGVLALEAGRRPLAEIAGWGEELEIPSLPEAVEVEHPVGVRNLTRGVQDTLHHGLDAEAVAIWRAGGLLARKEP